MAASSEEHCTGQQGADTSVHATQLRLRAEARQRRLLLSRASRQLQVFGGCPGDAMSGAGCANQCDTDYARKEQRPVSPSNCSPTDDDLIWGRSEASQHEAAQVEARTEVLVTQLSQKAESEPYVVSAGPRLRVQPTGSATAQFMADDAVAKRTHIESTRGLERGTCLRSEPDGGVFFGNADSNRTAGWPVRSRTAPVGSVTTPSNYRAEKVTESGYLTFCLLTSICSQLIKSLKVVLNGLQANLCLLRRLHVFTFIIVAVISALLPRAALPECPIPAVAPEQVDVRLPPMMDRRICCFLRYVILFFAGRPLFCIICATCSLVFVEHAPSVIERVSKERENDSKQRNPENISLSLFSEMQHGKGEFMQHQESSRRAATSTSRTAVCSTNSSERIRSEETQLAGIMPRLYILHAVLSNIFFLFQCGAALLRVLQLLAAFVVLHCVVRVGLVHVAIFAGCKEHHMPPLKIIMNTA